MTDLRQAYFFQGNDTGCLLIHGFTSTPAEVYELGCRLHRQGMTVLGVRLKGHGTDVEDFARSTEQDWLDSAREGLEQLRKTCRTVYVAGHSMGGLLALLLAARYPVERLILLAPAVVYRKRTTYLAGVARYIIKEYEWPADTRSEAEKKYLLQYKRFPMANVQKMTRLQRMARREMQKITAPTLLVMARKDALVHVKTASVLAGSMTAPLKTVWLEQSGHSVAVECEKETVFAACEAFLAQSDTAQ